MTTTTAADQNIHLGFQGIASVLLAYIIDRMHPAAKHASESSFMRARAYHLPDGLDAKPSLLRQLSQHWRNGKDLVFALFRALHYRQQAAISIRMGACIIFIETLQLLSFALNGQGADFAWHEQYVGWLRSLTKLSRPDVLSAADARSHQVSPVTIFVCGALIWLWLALFIAAGYLLHKARSSVLQPVSTDNIIISSTTHASAISSTGSKGAGSAKQDALSAVDALASTSWVFSSLRVVSNAAVTVCVIPLMGLMIQPLRCSNPSPLVGSHSHYECGDGLHVTLQAFGVVCAIIFTVLATLYVLMNNSALVSLEMHDAPSAETIFGEAQDQALISSSAGAHRSTSPTAGYSAAAFSRPHSRVELLYLILRGVLVIVFSAIAEDSTTTRWVLCAAYASVTFILAAAFTYYLPYLHWGMVQLRAVSLWLCVSAAIALVITILYDSNEHPTGSVMLLLGSPMVVAIAAFCITARRVQLENMDAALVLATRDILLIELKARLLLAGAAASRSAGASTAGQDFGSESTSTSAEPLLSASSSSSSSADDCTPVKGSSGTTRSAVSQAEALLQSACAQLTSSSLASLFLASFQLQYHRNYNRAGRLLLQTQQRSPPLDVHFSMHAVQNIIQRRLMHSSSAEEATALNTVSRAANRRHAGQKLALQSGTAEMITVPSSLAAGDVMSYLQYQEEVTRATSQVQAAMRLQHRFWSELLLPEPNAESLKITGQVIETSTAWTRAYVQDFDMLM